MFFPRPILFLCLLLFCPIIVVCQQTVEDEDEGGGGKFEYYFTCDKIHDWRAEKICNYMRQADDYIRTHEPVVPAMPGTLVDVDVVEEQPAAEATIPAVAGPAARPPCPAGGRQNCYGDENVAGGQVAKAIVKKKKEKIPFNALDCMTLECLCHYMDSEKCSPTKMLKKVVRREYRLISDEERNKFHSGLNALKKNGIYDNLVMIHQRFSNESAAAHFGPAFLPWHREFGKRMEFALRMLDPDAVLPYWDSTIEDALPRPNDSMLFTDELIGGTDSENHVMGDFDTWHTADIHQRLTRKVGQFTADPKNESSGVGKPFSEIDITRLMNGKMLELFLAWSSPKGECTPLVRLMDKYANTSTPYEIAYAMEYPHNYVHQFIGGHMGDTPLSANDPIFFLHHPFVDNVWEMFRQKYQSRSERETEYPPDDESCSNKFHFKASQMLPFWKMDEPDHVRIIRNSDGLSNIYTDQFYEYGPRPSCRMGPNCGSKYLFCDRTNGTERCVARIRNGGICRGFENSEICYQGKCVNGICVASSAGQQSAPQILQQQLAAPQNLERPPPPSKSAPNYVDDVVAKMLPSNNNKATGNAISASSHGSASVGQNHHQQCFNHYACCAIWAVQGECQRNPSFMNSGCKASCRICVPNYDINIECADRMQDCSGLVAAGDCQSNWRFMEENCRKSCGSCGKTRAEICAKYVSTRAQPAPSIQRKEEYNKLDKKTKKLYNMR